MTNHCPNCGNADVFQKNVPDVIPYGTGTGTVEIAVDLPIRHCNACGEEWEDADSFRAKHAAVCTHLGRLTPLEVLRVRTEIGSRERFSELTGIGPASLARWESGTLIQNAAYDLLLRAVADVAIRERLFALRTSNLVSTAFLAIP
jgi:putative zinc finger/helix-turn-helix YgiT family protein